MAEAARLSPSGGGIAVEGALDHRGVAALADASGDLFAGRTALAIDLASVTQGNSAGIALLLEWTRQARDAGCALTLRNLPPSLAAIAGASGVAAMLPIGDAG